MIPVDRARGGVLLCNEMEELLGALGLVKWNRNTFSIKLEQISATNVLDYLRLAENDVMCACLSLIIIRSRGTSLPLEIESDRSIVPLALRRVCQILCKGFVMLSSADASNLLCIIPIPASPPMLLLAPRQTAPTDIDRCASESSYHSLQLLRTV